jgi:hypothetical protein
VPEQPIETYHLQAAKNARHPAYQAALAWYEVLVDALDHDDAERLADVLCNGALRPGSDAKRFEIAVLLALLAGIEERLAGLGEFVASRDLIASDRRQVATFVGADGSCIEGYYDQAVLPPGKVLGARDRGVSHYLGSSGRLRPDITVRVQRPDGQVTYTVFEIKLSEDVGYAASGYAEATSSSRRGRGRRAGFEPEACAVRRGRGHGATQIVDALAAVLTGIAGVLEFSTLTVGGPKGSTVVSSMRSRASRARRRIRGDGAAHSSKLCQAECLDLALGVAGLPGGSLWRAAWASAGSAAAT